RLAAICQGVYRRALDGNASNPEKAKTYGQAVKLLAELAVELVDKER
ncbi:phosphotransferase family protein, partial [bacterium M00.F.Ca.ET.179.01.1.1]